MSCEFCQVQGTFWLRNESPNHAHSKLHTEGSHCSSFSLSSSRTGVFLTYRRHARESFSLSPLPLFFCFPSW
ncbi:hypothetical protein MRB53_009867 [Persea americana]|uniref:Uncharacterized protein n=2 Tax=Persea americana TaxID=3435 RepID=A0ACC2LQ91_PERAE|nr:hypothetical protein MRB53_009866 [Persea americana]KAJ8635600.1 hypothetical protein MRB53_009867 [Persea americana]